MVAALLILPAGFGGAAWFFTQRTDYALYCGGALFLVLGFWWFLLQWQNSISWLCYLQLVLAKLNLLPKDFPFWDQAAPWKVQSIADNAIKTALETVVTREKEVVASRHT